MRSRAAVSSTQRGKLLRCMLFALLILPEARSALEEISEVFVLVSRRARERNGGSCE